MHIYRLPAPAILPPSWLVLFSPKMIEIDIRKKKEEEEEEENYWPLICNLLPLEFSQFLSLFIGDCSYVLFHEEIKSKKAYKLIKYKKIKPNSS